MARSSATTTLQDVNKFSANPGSVVAGAINGYPQHLNMSRQVTSSDVKKVNSAQ